jgi:hypothetical protein
MTSIASLRGSLEHVPEKWVHFSDKDMLQLFELARILDRSGDSTRSEYALERDEEKWEPVFRRNQVYADCVDLSAYPAPNYQNRSRS